MAERLPIRDLTGDLTARLVSVRHWSDASFINLPMLYPSGAFVTVRLSHARDGIRVSDSGFAYREIDSFGAGRSFAQTAQAITDDLGVSVDKRSIFVDVPQEQIERAIYDVSAASHAVAERVVSRASREIEAGISDVLRIKLDHLFPDAVAYESKVIGASSTEWEVSAVAKVDSRSAVFQTVTNFPASVYKACSAFHDLAALDKPPSRIAVVESKAEMGKSIGLLSQAGRVIEIGQDEEVFLRAVA